MILKNCFHVFNRSVTKIFHIFGTEFLIIIYLLLLCDKERKPRAESELLLINYNLAIYKLYFHRTNMYKIPFIITSHSVATYAYSTIISRLWPNFLLFLHTYVDQKSILLVRHVIVLIST